MNSETKTFPAVPVPSPACGRGLGRGGALGNAKALRTHQTLAEQRLWYHLRAHRFEDLKFKRQKPIGSYIVDFVCMEQRLIVELDGGQHAEQVAYDTKRDEWLRDQGYKVLRFWNNDVMQNLEGVLEQIRNAFTLSPNPSPLRTPSPQSSPASGRGGEREKQCSIPGRGEPCAELLNEASNESPLPLAGEG